jgi:hypothetical protein
MQTAASKFYYKEGVRFQYVAVTITLAYQMVWVNLTRLSYVYLVT